MPMPGVMSRFTRYSPSNQLLVHLQRPHASKVLGFHCWRNAGYVIRECQRRILHPVSFVSVCCNGPR
jgi:hypothetical protein